MNASIQSPTQSPLPPESKPAAMPTESHAGSVGANATANGKPSIMLAGDQKSLIDGKDTTNSVQPGQEKDSGELNRQRALAVLWTGLEWLWKNRMAVTFNQTCKNGSMVLWIGIPWAYFTKKGELIEIERRK